VHGNVVSNPVPGRTEGPQGKVSGVRQAGAVAAGKASGNQVPSRASRKLTQGSVAIGRMLEFAASSGCGDRWGAFGDTGTGKTTLMRALVDAYESRVGGIAVIADDGGMAGYGGEEREDRADLARSPVTGTRVALVGNPYHGKTADPEEAAQVAWSVVRRRKKCVLVIDELNDCCRGGWWRKGVTMVPAAFTKGRKYGLSVVWTTQQVQDAPREPFNQTTAIACFRLVGLGVERLSERGYLEGMPEGTLEGLPGMDAPSTEVGTFVLLWRGRPWDGKFYRL
jgi:hypothetical protein